MSKRVELLVIGGGTAGIVSAKTGASLGAQPLLVERDRTGGDCLWTGCVPSKSLLAAAAAAATLRDASRLGVYADGVRVDFAGVMQHVRSAIRRIEPNDSPVGLQRAGVDVEHGDFTFTGPQRGVLNDREVRFDQAIITTGSAPAVPRLPGLDDVGYLTSDTVWDLDELPPRFAVLGGGNIGCELGQAFARLGSEVTMVEGIDRLLAREDPSASRVVEEALAADGVKVLTGTPVSKVSASPPGSRSGGSLHLADGATVEFTHLLVAVGRSPRSGALRLDAAGVEMQGSGHVRVSDHLRTTNPRLWAAGDITGHPQFTHVAGVHGSIAATNAVLGLRRRVDPTVPRVTFTHPEVAAVGVSTATPPTGMRLLSWPLAEVDRAITDAATEGFTRLAVDRKGRILGATVVGPRAGESLAEITLAIRKGMKTRDLAGTTHPYPTYSDAGWNAAIDDLRTRLASPPVARVVRGLAAVRRQWTGRRARHADLREERGVPSVEAT